MIAAMLSFVTGATLLQLAPALPPVSVIFVLFAAIPLLWWLFPRFRWVWALLFGAAWAALFAVNILSERLPNDFERRDLVVEGVVNGLPQARPKATRMTLDVEQGWLKGRPVALPGRIRLNWYGSAPPLAPGERWRLKVRLRRPHGFLNPGSFDYEGWLFQQGIGAVGYVRKSSENRRLDEGGLTGMLDRWRQGVGGWLRETLPDSAGSRILPALVIGDRGRLGPEDWRVFKRTGTNHLVAISGLHIGIVAGLAYFFAARLWCWLPGAPLRVPAPLVGYLSALVMAGGYAAMAGFSLPTRRALIMLAVMLVAQLLKRRGLSVRGLVIALFAVVAIDPLSVLSPGLWLSFAAVAAIFLATRQRLGGDRPGRQWIHVQLAVTLGIAPLLLFFFGEASAIAPLVNLVAVPLFSLFLIPLSLLAMLLRAVPVLGDMLLQGVVWSLDQSVVLMQQAAAWPAASWQMAAPPDWVWGALVFGVVLLLIPRGIPGRAMAGFLLLPLIAIPPQRPHEGAFRFTLLDVGQGLAAAVETHRHLFLFDTGPRFSRRFDAGEAVLLPFLRHNGWRRVDRLIVSHGDNDHAGGVDSLHKGVEVASLLAGEAEELDRYDAERCRTGMQWKWDGVHFEILSPDSSLSQAGNNRSCVLRVSNGSGSVLLPGDIERGIERRLVRSGQPLHATVVVAPHHGSETSSSPSFVSAVRPRFVLYAVGYRNPHNFPRGPVVDRWLRSGATGLSTADSGAVRFDFPSTGEVRGPVAERTQRLRFWHDSPR